MPQRAGVIAAGALVVRRSGSEVLLVHRPKYDDWSFPKGKKDPGEHVTATAVREVREETGLRIRLGRPLPSQSYAVSGGRAKTVHYWVGRVRGDDDVSGWVANHEIDAVRWVPRSEAGALLSYLDDVRLLDHLANAPGKTHALLVVRHGKAVPRKTWSGADPLRPLAHLGKAQARAIAPMLRAYGVRRLVTSPSLRCQQTLAPIASGDHLTLVEEPALTEEDFSAAGIGPILHDLLDGPSAALCTHRPVLPLLLEMLGVCEEPLATGEAVVVHHHRTQILATERHLVRAKGSGSSDPA